MTPEQRQLVIDSAIEGILRLVPEPKRASAWAHIRALQAAGDDKAASSYWDGFHAATRTAPVSDSECDLEDAVTGERSVQ